MNNSRMSNKDMLNYCDEALSWGEFGPVDIFFFESVKKILLGECSPEEEPEIDDLLGIERPVGAEELAPDYDKYADEYYDEEIPDVSEDDDSQEVYTVSTEDTDDITDVSEEMKIFADALFADGFFDADSDDDEEDDDETDIPDDDTPDTDEKG